jgi:hypothetical protein
MTPAQNGATFLSGVVHGKTVELDKDAGLPDGQRVSVLIQPKPQLKLPPGEGLLRAFGGWSDDPQGVDGFVDEVRRLRDLDVTHREIEP